MNSGGHPAITPFTATWRTVTARWAGGIAPKEVLGGRSVNDRNSATAFSVGSAIGSPSVQPESRNTRCSSSYDPVSRESSVMGLRSARSRVSSASVNAFLICGHRMLRVLASSSSRVCEANAPGYSATRRTSNPAERAALFACFTNPGAAIITDGIPNASAAMHDPVSFGVHRPHPPFPERVRKRHIRLPSAGDRPRPCTPPPFLHSGCARRWTCRREVPRRRSSPSSPSWQVPL